jgi:glycosyltransferase involved in cell wall biosynthesis
VPAIHAAAPHTPVWVLTPFPDPAMVDRAAGPPLAQRDAALFVGGFRHAPNVDAAMVLVRDVMPLVWQEEPAARVLVVGEAPPVEVLALASERVTITGHVPDIAGMYAQARLTVSPLRFGAGLRGKVIESLAVGVPVVTTPIGCEGIGLTNGVDGLLGENPVELATCVVRLLREPSLAASLADAGRRLIRERYSAERTRATLLEALGCEEPG